MDDMAVLEAEARHEAMTDRSQPRLGPRRARLLDEAAKGQIYRQSLRGVPAEALGKQLGRSRAEIEQVINEMRARRLLETRLEFIADESFDAPGATEEILGPDPVADKAVPPRRGRAPEGLPPYLASLYDVPLLTPEQERHLFRKMNYLKYRAHQLREQLDPTRARTEEINAIEWLQEEALAVKNQIIRANLRLVVSIAKRHVGPSNNFFELVSDGNMSLIRAVEKFDYARGNKFSTYASWAIMRNFIRSIPEENHRRDRFITGHEEMFEAAADTRTDEREYESHHRRHQETVEGLLGRLSDRERRILTSRFGLGGATEQTLEQLGHELGVTKERVRQLEAKAREKLRKIAIEEKLDLI
jgi:RNA polymerase sigma factor (sigma-70 family)